MYLPISILTMQNITSDVHNTILDHTINKDMKKKQSLCMLLLYDYQFSTGLLLLLFGIIISTNSNFDRAD